MQYLTHTVDDDLLRFMPLPDDFVLPPNIEIDPEWSDECSLFLNAPGFAIITHPTIVDDASYIAFEKSLMFYCVIMNYERDDNLVNELLTLT